MTLECPETPAELALHLLKAVTEYVEREPFGVGPEEAIGIQGAITRVGQKMGEAFSSLGCGGLSNPEPCHSPKCELVPIG